MTVSTPRLLGEQEVAARGVAMTHDNLLRLMGQGFPGPWTKHAGQYFWRSDEIDAYFASEHAREGGR